MHVHSIPKLQCRVISAGELITLSPANHNSDDCSFLRGSTDFVSCAILYAMDGPWKLVIQDMEVPVCRSHQSDVWVWPARKPQSGLGTNVYGNICHEDEPDERNAHNA
eukprot:gb/GECG01009855.1/.p1 GENE.gb/GECG01009855.1/~~gb/GECG01009855.1/.p1  ORF type:complete len:108 (+),score=7.12 gb/GECG01009855.1/:1-324(+)